MEFRDHDHVVEVAVFAPVVSHAAIRELIGSVRVLLLVAPRCLSDDQNPYARDQTAPPQGKERSSAAFVATGSRDKTIKLWDAASGQCVRTLVGLQWHYLSCVFESQVAFSWV
jgi:platelet-activating factor acetylhydrolase IB subunit alpha